MVSNNERTDELWYQLDRIYYNIAKCMWIECKNACYIIVNRKKEYKVIFTE